MYVYIVEAIKTRYNIYIVLYSSSKLFIFIDNRSVINYSNCDKHILVMQKHSHI